MARISQGMALWVALLGSVPSALADEALAPAEIRRLAAAPAALAPEVAGAERLLRAPCVSPCDPCRARGPVEVREEWILAQPRLTLPAISPDPLCCGQWDLRVAANRGNDFGWRQSGPAEAPLDRLFLIDGEHQTTEFVARYGLSHTFSVAVRVPIQWRGAGFMDGSIDWFHELGAGIGFADNGRKPFTNDRYRAEGRDDNFNAISWTDDHGLGLGNVEVSAHYAFLRPCRPCGWRGAVVGRVGLPTGTGPFDTGSLDLGLQVVFAKQLGTAWDVYGGVGGTWFQETEDDGVEYEPLRAHGFLALEWRFARAWSLLLQTDAATRLVTNLAEYPAEQWYVHVAARADLGGGWQLEGGFTENIADQQSTVDIGAFMGISLRR